uniref:Protein archease n=1 Tax=Rattus norvegicus TaxID=10116 RepID=A0ABK0LLV5_RAT
MAQEEEDVRDYNLTEEQKAIKNKYPPVNRKYEYLDHTADVQLHAWGDTLEEAFEQCAMAMFGYMTDTGTVEPLQTVEVETQGDDLQSLLFHFLDEWLYRFSADEYFIPREVKVLNIDQKNFKLRSIGWGEEFSLSKHPQIGRAVLYNLHIGPVLFFAQMPPAILITIGGGHAVLLRFQVSREAVHAHFREALVTQSVAPGSFLHHLPCEESNNRKI